MTIDKKSTISASKFTKPILDELMLGEAFRVFRKSDDLSLTELADRLGVSRQFLSDVELGRKQVGISFIEGFARELGYGIEPFLRLFLRDQLKRHGLDYIVNIEKRAG